MQNTEFFWIVILAITGILSFTGLEKSLKAKSKFPKVVYLIVAITCSVVMMEAILKILLIKTDADFPYLPIHTVATILMRLLQGGLIIIGILILIEQSKVQNMRNLRSAMC